MGRTLTTALEVVRQLGGAEMVAKMFNCGDTTVYHWTARNKFPAKTYLAIRELLASSDLDAPDELWAMVKPEASSELRETI